MRRRAVVTGIGRGPSNLLAAPSLSERAPAPAESIPTLACSAPSEEAKPLAVELTNLADSARRVQPA